jgi:hypothetical protein
MGLVTTTREYKYFGLRPSAIRGLNVIVKTDDWWTVRTIGDALAKDETGRLPLKARTTQDSLKQLVAAELIEVKGILGSAGDQWCLTCAQSAEIEAEHAF